MNLLRLRSFIVPVCCVAVAVFVTLTTDMGRRSDWTVLQSIWFSKIKGDSHAERLESFYASQAGEYDSYRRRLLWAREPLLDQLATAIDSKTGLIWVDLGGGTGSNVELMEDYIPISRFEAVYIVDLCPSLCEEARKRVHRRGWKNVHVVEHDACTYTLPPDSDLADIVTFSYAVSMIPNYIAAIEQSIGYMRDDGWIGVCDFYVSAKYDVPERQMSWFRRFFWQMIFDLDGVFLGSERRLYLENRFETDWEMNGNGTMPYVPFLRAPWYAWIGKKRQQTGRINH